MICARVSIHRYFTRAFVTNSGFNVPRKGDRGTQPSVHAQMWNIDKFYLVVIAMSGGVDSSVTALLLAKQVCQKKIQHKTTSFKRMLLLGF
jgi:asparagine synthetase B (glutamine-hydrolysing)